MTPEQLNEIKQRAKKYTEYYSISPALAWKIANDAVALCDEIVRLRELVKDAFCEGVLYRGDDSNPWLLSDAKAALEGK